MTRLRFTGPALAAAIVTALLPLSAVAASFQPLEAGSFWEYRGVSGAHQVETITGMLVLHGRAVAVKSYAEGPDAGLQNFWLLDADGSVLLAGFHNTVSGDGWVYEPPIRYLPVPPVAGVQPPQTVTVYDFTTDAVINSITQNLGVEDDPGLTVPVGTFHAFGVGQVIVFPAPGAVAKRALALDGRAVAASAPGIYAVSPTDWYAEGVGVVQYLTTDTYQLVGFGLPTPIARSSWSAIKRLFH